MTHTIFLKLFLKGGAGAGIPTNRGTGASKSSRSESGTIGKSTWGQIKGLIKFLSPSLNIPYTTEVMMAKLQLTTTMDFSSNMAFQSQKKSSNLSKENKGLQSQTLSTQWTSAGKLREIGSCIWTSMKNEELGKGSDLFL